MCIYKTQQWVCLGKLIIPNAGFEVGLQPTVPEKLCRKTWESRYGLSNCEPGSVACRDPDRIILRRYFGLCGPCMEIAQSLYHDRRSDFFQQYRIDLPYSFEGWFGLPTDVVHHSVDCPPFAFWLEIGRQDGGGLELEDMGVRWALCSAISGQEFVGDGQCVRDFWNEETRNYTLTEEQYVEKVQEAREAYDEDEGDSNTPSMHGFQQHLRFNIDPGI